MRHLLVPFFLFICTASFSQQAVEKKEGNYQLTKVFSDNFSMHIYDCHDSALYDMFIKTSDHLRRPVSSCLTISDTFLPGKLHEALMAQEDLKSKTGFVAGLNAEDGGCYFCVFVFTQKSLKQYDRKLAKQHVLISHPGGEVRILNDAKPSKYAEVYLLTSNDSTFTVENITKKI